MTRLYFIDRVEGQAKNPFELKFTDAPGLKWLVFAMGFVTTSYILIYLGFLLWGLITSIPEAKNEYVNFRNHVTLALGVLAAFGAAFGIVFGAIRVWTTERQTRTAESQKEHQELVLLNSRIQDALALLSARTPETRLGRTVFYTDNGRQSLHQWHDAPEPVPNGVTDINAEAWQNFTHDVPDIQTRLSGIGRLKALVKEHPDEHRAINEHLAFFLRANSDASTAEKFDIAEPDLSGSSKERRENTEKYKRAIREWARKLKLQPDLQAAIALITSVEDEKLTAFLDLRNINLQGADLPSAHLKKIRLDGTQMQGADLFRAQIQGANFVRARMQGATLTWAQIQGADLSWAQMDSKTDLRDADFSAAALYSVDFRKVIFSQEQINSAFGDASVSLAKVMARPAHWPDTNLEIQDFDKEYRLWQSDPTTYKPPQSRP